MLDIFIDYCSQPCRAVGMLCKAIDAPHKEHQILLMKGEHRTPEYMSINPFHKIPAVKDGSTLINESCAAMRYIASKYDKTGKWYPQDLDVRAKVDEYLDWQHTNTRKHGVGYFSNKIVIPYRTKQPMDVDLVTEHEKELVRVEKDFVKYFLDAKPFITGNQLTIADLAAACEFEQPLQGGFEFQQPLKDYLQRVRTALGPLYDQVSKDLFDAMKV